MACATYVAKRGLVSYHTLLETYELDFKTSAIVRPNGGDLKVVQETISGSKETQFYGERRVWSITTIPVQLGSAQELLVLEFLRSTADGQSFTLDPYGVAGAVVRAITVTREDTGYSEELFKEIDGVTDYVIFSFQVREV